MHSAQIQTIQADYLYKQPNSKSYNQSSNAYYFKRRPIVHKEYGSADPTLRAQFEGLNGEQVYVTFTREGAGTVEGERVGTYDLLTPTSQDDNYTAVINPASGNDLFEITALTGLVLRGTLSGDPVSHVYNGHFVATKC